MVQNVRQEGATLGVPLVVDAGLGEHLGRHVRAVHKDDPPVGARRVLDVPDLPGRATVGEDDPLCHLEQGIGVLLRRLDRDHVGRNHVEAQPVLRPYQLHQPLAHADHVPAVPLEELVQVRLVQHPGEGGLLHVAHAVGGYHRHLLIIENCFLGDDRVEEVETQGGLAHCQLSHLREVVPNPLPHVLLPQPLEHPTPAPALVPAGGVLRLGRYQGEGVEGDFVECWHGGYLQAGGGSWLRYR